MFYRSCPHCIEGTLEVLDDNWGKYISCVNCGWQKQLVNNPNVPILSFEDPMEKLKRSKYGGESAGKGEMNKRTQGYGEPSRRWIGRPSMGDTKIPADYKKAYEQRKKDRNPRLPIRGGNMGKRSIT